MAKSDVVEEDMGCREGDEGSEVVGLDSILGRGDERPVLGECRLADALASNVEGVTDDGRG